MNSKVFEESGLTFDFSASENPYKADSKEFLYNGLSAVDFIVEMPESYFLIEVKNLENPKIPSEFRTQQKDEFLLKLRSNTDKSERSVFQGNILRKLKDTLLRMLAFGERLSKPVIYILLLEYGDLGFNQRRLLFEQINSNIPKFSESEYTSIHSVKFGLCDKTEYEARYGLSFRGESTHRLK